MLLHFLISANSKFYIFSLSSIKLKIAIKSKKTFVVAPTAEVYEE